MMVEISTENAETRKFSLSGSISSKQKTYNDATEALGSPIASKIFGFPWTQQVTVGTDFVSVTKQEWVTWDILEEPLKGLIKEHFEAQSGTIEENPEIKQPENQDLSSPEAQAIQKLIEEQINPALESHGGFVVLHGIKDDQVFLEMGGGCQGCAMSYQTMKEGIEGAIKKMLPQIREVVDVTNHSAGSNPYYKE